MCEKHCDILENVLESSEVARSVAQKFMDESKVEITLSEKEALEMILGRADLSQRGYENLRNIMEKAGVHLPSYKKVMEYESKLDVGPILPIHDTRSCSCQGYKTDLHDTIQVHRHYFFNTLSHCPARVKKITEVYHGKQNFH